MRDVDIEARHRRTVGQRRTVEVVVEKTNIDLIAAGGLVLGTGRDQILISGNVTILG